MLEFGGGVGGEAGADVFDYVVVGEEAGDDGAGGGDVPVLMGVGGDEDDFVT